MVALAPVVSNPAPVTVPPDQLNALFTVTLPLPDRIPPDMLRDATVLAALMLTVPDVNVRPALALSGPLAVKVPPLMVRLPARVEVVPGSPRVKAPPAPRVR